MNGRPWTLDDDALLRRLWCVDGRSHEQIAAALGRTAAAVKARIGFRAWRRSPELRTAAYRRAALAREARRVAHDPAIMIGSKRADEVLETPTPALTKPSAGGTRYG